MKRAIFYIKEHQNAFQICMKNEYELLLLQGKKFETERACEKFVDILRLHMRFQTNFNRTKNMSGRYGFEVRTCWDELIAKSLWYNTREDREAAMQETFEANKQAVFAHTSMYMAVAPSLSSRLQDVA